MTTRTLPVLLFLAIAPFAGAQEASTGLGPSAVGAVGAVPAAFALPREFRGIELGMSMAEVEALLAADGLFAFRGAPDVSLLPRPDESLIEVAGLSFVKRAFFQFHADRLFVMIFSLNEDRIDHYTLFTRLSGKYGKPTSLSPSESVWIDGVTRMSIERPLAVKYIDLAVFEELRAAGEEERGWEDILREEFLGGF